MPLCPKTLAQQRDIRAHMAAWSQQQGHHQHLLSRRELQWLSSQCLNPDGCLTLQLQTFKQADQQLGNRSITVTVNDDQQWAGSS